MLAITKITKTTISFFQDGKLDFARNFLRLRCSTCPLVFGCWELSHVIFLILRKKELVAKLRKFTK